MTTKERRCGVRRQFFSFRDLVQRKRRNKGQREFVHQVGAGPGGKIARDLVQRKRRNKVQGDFVHQVGAAPGGKIARDLVQRKRRNKVQREFVHQVGVGPGVKTARDLVQRKRKNKGQRVFVHQVPAAPRPEARHFGQQPHRARPEAPNPGGRLPPQPVVKSTHLSTFTFPRIIIKFT